MSQHSKETVSEGFTNVFAALDLPNADELHFKAQLAARILKTIDAQGFTQTQAAAVVGLKQPDISNLRRGKLEGLSVERLFAVLNRLGHTVEITIHDETPDEARVLIAA